MSRHIEIEIRSEEDAVHDNALVELRDAYVVREFEIYPVSETVTAIWALVDPYTLEHEEFDSFVNILRFNGPAHVIYERYDPDEGLVTRFSYGTRQGPNCLK